VELVVELPSHGDAQLRNCPVLDWRVPGGAGCPPKLAMTFSEALWQPASLGKLLEKTILHSCNMGENQCYICLPMLDAGHLPKVAAQGCKQPQASAQDCKQLSRQRLGMSY